MATRIEKIVNKAISTDRQKAFYSHVMLSYVSIYCWQSMGREYLCELIDVAKLLSFLAWLGKETTGRGFFFA